MVEIVMKHAASDDSGLVQTYQTLGELAHVGAKVIVKELRL